MKRIILISVAIAAFAACNKPVINTQAGYGHIVFNLSADNTFKVELKSGTDDDYTYDVSDFTVTVGDASYKYSELDQVMRIAAGTYAVAAENCTVAQCETGNGMLRMADSKSITILPDETKTAVLRCTPMCSEVNLVYSDAYRLMYPSSIFTLTGTRNGVENTRLSLIEGTPVYYNNTLDGRVNVSYEIKALGDVSDAKTTFAGTLTLKNAYSLTVNVDVVNAEGKISIDLKATDTLTGESSSILVDPYSGTSTIQ